MQTVRAIVQAVAVPGTPERVSNTTATVTVRKFWVVAQKVGGANAGNVFLGTSTVDNATDQQLVLAPGDYWEMDSPPHTAINLSDVWVDAINAADGVVGGYLSA